ncbi:HD domain-containing protein [Amycolatopsis sp. K13G38]|uniref:HD domain-containing protein n=1 Tax=Amycolatopsis acididurans TaxID=2724524 RepID=A0ABX1JFR3_9PSEU|nr:HD domain-containing protein [Amycolatopsis acididurans]NKQ58234.1 HD domain-containing protein [Amycolatopsis acididurans]
MDATSTLEQGQEDQLRRLEHNLVREHDELPPDVVRYEIAQAHASFASARITTFVPILVERVAQRRLSSPSIGADVPHTELVRCPSTYSAEMPLRTWGWYMAKQLLADESPRRWAHTQGVARRAAEVAGALPPEDRQVLVAAAWLHDIGYAEEVIDTGFHQLDGARYLLAHGAPRRVCALVAHHSGAAAVAEVRGLSAELGEFDDEHGPVRDALWYCDMTTGPDGTPMSFAERMRELRARRSPDDPAIQALATNEDERASAVQRTEHLLQRTLTPA